MTVANRTAYIISAVAFAAVALALLLGFGDEMTRAYDWVSGQIDSL